MRLDPLHYHVDATGRGLTDYHESPPRISLLVALVVASASVAAAVALVARRWRLKS